MVYGPPKVGKSVFAYQFLNESIRVKGRCFYVMVDYSFHDLSLATSGFGFNIAEAVDASGIQFVDMSSTQSEKQGSESGSYPKGLRLVSLADPTDLMRHSTEVLKGFSANGMRFRTILDSLTPLFIYNPPMIVAKVLRQFGQRMKSAGCQGIMVTYTEGSVDPQSEVIIKSSVDNLVHLHDGEVVVEGMLGTPKARASYEIGRAGIQIGGGPV